MEEKALSIVCIAGGIVAIVLRKESARKAEKITKMIFPWVKENTKWEEFSNVLGGVGMIVMGVLLLLGVLHLKGR
jgi:hypothetical protein